jgi:curli biogenesis system outer membrane secretion channel CsgG
MKSYLTMVLLSLFTLVGGCAPIHQYSTDANTASDFPPLQNLKVGVLTFIAPEEGISTYSTLGGQGSLTTPSHVGQSVADALANALMEVARIEIIERSQLEKILKEQGLSVSGVTQEPDFSLLGQIMPVDALVLGTVSRYDTWRDATWGAAVAYSARMVDIRSGKTMLTLNCSGAEQNGMPESLALRLAKDAVSKATKVGKG